MSETVKVGAVEAKPGSKAPVHIVNGKEPGPTLAIIAGIHPVEHPAMEGTIRLVNDLDPEKLHGTLITIPVFNIPGFQARVPWAPLPYPFGSEKTLLTAAFPGSPEGSPNQRAAHFVTTEILGKSNYAIETHGCNYMETCPNHIIMRRTGDTELDKSSLMLARCFEGKYVRGAMEHQIRKPRPGGYSVMRQALNLNVPCILPEVGSLGGISSTTGQLNEPDIKWFMDGVKNFMKKVGMLKGEAKLYDPRAVKTVIHHRAKNAGLFYPMKPNGAKVSKGETIGLIKDMFGDVREQIDAEVDGVISLIWTRPAVDHGSVLVQMFELGPKSSTLFP